MMMWPQTNDDDVTSDQWRWGDLRPISSNTVPEGRITVMSVTHCITLHHPVTPCNTPTGPGGSDWRKHLRAGRAWWRWGSKKLEKEMILQIEGLCESGVSNMHEATVESRHSHKAGGGRHSNPTMGWLRRVGSLKLYVSCKWDLLKRRYSAQETYNLRWYSAQETYNFKEPTIRSHSICPREIPMALCLKLTDIFTWISRCSWRRGGRG